MSNAEPVTRPDQRSANNTSLRAAIDATAAIRASQDFLRWTQSDLQNVLPHEVSCCGIGKWNPHGLKMAKTVACNFPRRYLDELRTPEGRLHTYFLARWFRQQKPQLYAPKVQFGELPCRTNFNSFGLSNMVMHGVLDRESGRVSLFSFFRLPIEPTPRHARLLKILAPHMQKALVRSLAPSFKRSGKSGQCLSQRECEILRLIASGRSDTQIANELLLSPKTVSHHVTNILAKLKANNRAHAVAIGIGHRLISVEEKY